MSINAIVTLQSAFLQPADPAAYPTPLWSQLREIGVFNAHVGVVERLQCGGSQGDIGDAGRLIAGMHGQLRQAHVDGVHAHLHIRQVPQRRPARHVASVRKALQGHARILAYRAEHRTAKGIGAVLLVRRLLHCKTAVEHDAVALVVELGMVRMHGVGVVAAGQHALRQRAPQLPGA